MPENTDHPTQKSEKLVAKLLLASTNPGDLVFRSIFGQWHHKRCCKEIRPACFGIELDEEYALLAQRRLEIAETDARFRDSRTVFFGSGTQRHCKNWRNFGLMRETILCQLDT